MAAVLAAEPELHSAARMHVPHRTNCFEIFGLDILLDDKCKAYLVDVNTGPDLKQPSGQAVEAQDGGPNVAPCRNCAIQEVFLCPGQQALATLAAPCPAVNILAAAPYPAMAAWWAAAGLATSQFQLGMPGCQILLQLPVPQTKQSSMFWSGLCCLISSLA